MRVVDNDKATNIVSGHRLCLAKTAAGKNMKGFLCCCLFDVLIYYRYVCRWLFTFGAGKTSFSSPIFFFFFVVFQLTTYPLANKQMEIWFSAANLISERTNQPSQSQQQKSQSVTLSPNKKKLEANFKL